MNTQTYMSIFKLGLFDKLAPVEFDGSSDYRLILDAGHGGIHPISNEYVTAPKKMWNYGTTSNFHHFGEFYEGVSNRIMVDKMARLCLSMGVSYSIVSHHWKDNKLSNRVDTANRLVAKHPQDSCVYISYHSDSHDTTADGYAIWTSKGDDNSDDFATHLWKSIESSDIPMTLRSQSYIDSDPDYEADFYVIKNTKCPAVLLEIGFFDNKKDAMTLINEVYQNRITKIHLSAIMDYFK